MTKRKVDGQASALSQHVGSRIRLLRKAKGWAAVGFAEELGIGGNTLSQHETGTNNIGLEALEAYAKALGVPPSLLLEDYEP